MIRKWWFRVICIALVLAISSFAVYNIFFTTKVTASQSYVSISLGTVRVAATLEGYSYYKSLTITGATGIAQETNYATGGTCTANYENPPNETAPKLNDGNYSTKWLALNHNTAILQNHLASAYAITRYNLVSGNDNPDRDPKNWTLYGSNNGTDWTSLDSKTGETFASRGLKKTYDFTNETSYSYYKFDITLNNGGVHTQLAEWELCVISGGTPPNLTNYQMKVTVYKGSGTDDANSIYLNNHCLDDFADIRFTKSDQDTLLDYYRESYTSGTSAVFWIEVDSILGSPNTTDIYIFYGKGGDSTASNGFNTFLAFEDMLSTPVGTLAGDATYDGTNHWVQLTPNLGSKSGRLYYTISGHPDWYGIKFLMMDGHTNGADATFGFSECSSVPTNESSAYGGYYGTADEYADQMQFRYNGTSLSTAAQMGIDDGSWHTVEYKITPAGTGNAYYLYWDGTLKVSGSGASVPSSGNNYFGYCARTGGSFTDHYLGLSFIYQWRSDSPVFSAWGEETPVGGGTPSISESPTTWTLNAITGSGKAFTNTTYYANPLGDTTAPSATVAQGECQFLITNTSTGAIDLTANMSDFSGGSDNSTNSNNGSNGATSFGAYCWYKDETYSSKQVMATSSATGNLYSNLGASTNLYWGAEVKTQSNAWGGANSATSTILITATAH